MYVCLLNGAIQVESSTNLFREDAEYVWGTVVIGMRPHLHGVSLFTGH